MATLTDNQGNQQTDPWFLRSTAPVFLPAHHALTIPETSFEEFLRHDMKLVAPDESIVEAQPTAGDFELVPGTDTDTVLVSEVDMSEVSTTGDIREQLNNITVDTTGVKATPAFENDHPFMQGLLSHQQHDGGTAELENKMLTENADMAYRSTTEPLVDLFSELEDVVSGPRLLELLEGAWRVDPVATLKIIFNARSIHLGKASRQTFYRCAGWLAKNHPQTLIANLPWLSRPVIQKKVENQGEKKAVDEDDMVIIEKDTEEDESTRFDVRNGVAHGYWKDLLNLLALHVNGTLDVLANPRDILNVEQEKKRFRWPKTKDEVKSARHEKRDARHTAALRYFNEDPVYRGLHLSVARLFAAQLKIDMALLQRKDAAAKRKISLCAKWAPSAERFHDKHTFIVSSIAEILHPLSEFKGFNDHDPSNVDQRTFYLRHARDAYRRDVAALRKHLGIVERDITANAYNNIKYDRVPSTAMNNYAPLFAKKDMARFEDYIDKVAAGKARISGATLLPSTLIRAVRQEGHMYGGSFGKLATERKIKGTKDLVQAKVEEMAVRTLDLQWNTLVQRIKDSGTLENCIAVADVSGSMYNPVFPDGTCPMDSSIGLALLIAEVTKPPFGGAFITFSTEPTVEAVDLSSSLEEKFGQLARSKWGMSTDFVAVFEKLILPMAVENKLKQEDMVKRVFVFSDMQFDAACSGHRGGGEGGGWSTSYERIEQRFRDAGYEVPELVFWNLAGGRAGYAGGGGGGGPRRYGGAGDPTAPKPVTAWEAGTALVSGYSQGMLKVFLDSGSFEDEEAGEEIVDKIGDDGEVIVERVKRQKMDPMSIVRKAIGHKAYSMLRVVD